MSKKFDLQKFKDTVKVAEVPYKSDSYVKWNDALSLVSGLPGLPMGHVVQCYGPSNGGKTSLGFHLAAQAQKQDILPIFIIAEGKMSTDRAKLMGVALDEAITLDATYIEDIFEQLLKYMNYQAKGDLPKDLLFIVDSIGNTISRDSVKTDKNGNVEIGGAMMKVSKVIREQMRVLSHRINDTRKVNSPKTASVIFINHSYKQPPQFPGGPTSDIAYGGDGVYYASSLVIKVKKAKQLKAIKDSQNVSFGILTKLTIEKNHINGISNSGEFVIVPDTILPNDPDVIKDYKEQNKANWGTAEIISEDGEVL